jgi:uncharacterized glyoxalase superfamily protein PhnB
MKSVHLLSINKMKFKLSLFTCLWVAALTAQTLPQTGISGVYEVMLATPTPQYDRAYFAEFGFRVVDSAKISAEQAFQIYGVKSALTAYRLQNGAIDAHGLLRLLVWDKPTGNGIGYSAPETVGRRMAVMHCRDIFRLTDIFRLERQNGKKWLVTEPAFDVIYKTSKTENPDFFNRQVGVRENAVYGEYFAHVFFQRYGYDVAGYGTINDQAPLSTSEFTHHDFIVKGDTNAIKYYSNALGMRQESAVVLDGDWQRGPKQTFVMPDAYSHLYVGFVSPNDICGKLKFFFPQQPVPDKSAEQKIGALGISLHSFCTPKLDFVFDLVKKEGIKPTNIQKNEFGERSFVFVGPDGVAWQIIERAAPKNPPKTQFELTRTGK